MKLNANSIAPECTDSAVPCDHGEFAGNSIESWPSDVRRVALI
jgi:hypothetical protein